MTETNNILKNTILTGLFALLFVPFITSNDLFFPFIAPKDFVFRFVVEILLVIWLVLCLRDRNYLPKKNLIFISLSLFVVIIFLADLFAVNKTIAFWSNYERMDGFVRLIHIYVFFIMLATTVRGEKVWNYFLGTSVISSVAMSFYGFLQLFGKLGVHHGGDRLDGTLGNPTYLAVFMLINIFFTMYLFYKNKNKTLRYLLGVAFVLQIITLYHTATRGAILGLIGGFLLTALISIFVSKKKNIKQIGIAVAVAIAIFVGLFLSFKESDFVQNSPVLERFAGISLENKTTLSRFIVWDIAGKGFKERPLLGWGQGNFNLIFDKNYDVRMYNQEQWFDRAHNIIMDWLVAGGILGLLSYLSIIFATLWLIWKRTELDSIEKSILTGLLSAYFFQNLFVFDQLVSYMLFAVFLAYVYNQSADQHDHRVKPLIEDKNQRMIASLFSVVAILFIFYSVNVPAYAASENLIKGLQFKSVQGRMASVYEEGINKNIDYLKKSLDKETFGSAEIRIQVLTAATRIFKSLDVDAQTREQFAQFALSEMEKQIELTPEDTKYYFALGVALAEMGDLTNSQLFLEKAISISPDKHVIRNALTQVYSLAGQSDKAVSFSKETYEKEIRSDDSWVVYTSALVRAGQTEEYTKLINEAIANQQYQRVESFMKIAINQNPNNMQSYVSLAAFYDQIGNDESAIQTLELAKQRFPDQSATLDKFIEQVKSN